jgi:hypothetical protein
MNPLGADNFARENITAPSVPRVGNSGLNANSVHEKTQGLQQLLANNKEPIPTVKAAGIKKETIVKEPCGLLAAMTAPIRKSGDHIDRRFLKKFVKNYLKVRS